MMRLLTAKDIAALRAIDEFVTEHGFAISTRELGEAIGVSSSSTAHERVRRLRAQGLVDVRPMGQRTIRVSLEGMRVLLGQVSA